MVESPNQRPELESLTRTQVLIAMGVTAVLLLFAARIWQHFDPLATLPLIWNSQHLFWGSGLALGITALSAVIYQLWPQYRHAATLYLQLVVKPLTWSDILWLGLLPGLSEELLFRGVMLPALGLNMTGVIYLASVLGCCISMACSNGPMSPG